MKLFKRTRAAVLCAVMAAALILPAGVRAEEGGAGRQAAKVLSRIRLSVGDGQETPVFKAGEETELRIKVRWRIRGIWTRRTCRSHRLWKIQTTGRSIWRSSAMSRSSGA